MANDTTGSVEATHAVENQPPPLPELNLYVTDRVLTAAVARGRANWAEARLSAFGAEVGSARVQELGRQANRHLPKLETHDRFGRRIDEVRFHPAWHELMALAMAAGAHCLPWVEPRAGSHVARAALAFLMNQAETGVCCPLAMTFAARPSLMAEPAVAAEWLPRTTASTYDPRNLPAGEKTAATLGMAMTEKQGGSDVRANTTRAEPDGAGAYLLTGHKWFCSAPMSDGFLTLAQAPGGLTCFLAPRWRPDGSRNAIEMQRLKDKLGNRSNASAEIEYRAAWASRIGEEGRGVATILQMVQWTRLDVSLSSAALMRRALIEALNHAGHRRAFQKTLIDQPLMANLLADLALESEAATLMALSLAEAHDRAGEDAEAAAFARVATAITKYWTGTRAPGVVFEAMQVLGGNGYVEDSVMPRLYRETPLSAIWEGCGNVICLDVQRALQKAPESGQALLAELERAKGADRRLDRAVEGLRQDLGRPLEEAAARRLVARLATALEAALMVRHAGPAAADHFCASRLEGPSAGYGTLAPGPALREIAAAAEPA